MTDGFHDQMGGYI